MNCVGIDFCSKKNCLEQERCVFNVNRHTEWVEVKRGPKKKKPKPKNRNNTITKKCQFGKTSCNKNRICAMLGQCVLEHSLVKDNPDVYTRLSQSKSILTVLRAFNQLSPPVTLRGQFKKYKSRK